MLFFRADIGFKNGGSYTGDTEDLFVIILKRGFKNGGSYTGDTEDLFVIILKRR
jgi:hypothetical protein